MQIAVNLKKKKKNIKAAVHPTDTLLVVDAMTGQEAATLVKTFNDEVDISGELQAGSCTPLARLHSQTTWVLW